MQEKDQWNSFQVRELWKETLRNEAILVIDTKLTAHFIINYVPLCFKKPRVQNTIPSRITYKRLPKNRLGRPCSNLLNKG